jgi:hypothetical protein
MYAPDVCVLLEWLFLRRWRHGVSALICVFLKSYGGRGICKLPVTSDFTWQKHMRKQGKRNRAVLVTTTSPSTAFVALRAQKTTAAFYNASAGRNELTAYSKKCRGTTVNKMRNRIVSRRTMYSSMLWLQQFLLALRLKCLRNCYLKTSFCVNTLNLHSDVCNFNLHWRCHLNYNCV